MSNKAGFVGLIGRPNAGKSTLLNTILKEKIAIVTDKPQTTRNVIRGIYNDEQAQIVFFDTPGLHMPKDALSRQMVQLATTTIPDVDVVYFLVDANKSILAEDKRVLDLITKNKKPTFLIVNKIDQCSKKELLEKLTEWSAIFPFDEIIPISALNNDNVDRLLSITKTYLEDQPMFYPPEMIMDMSERFVISEMIREKILMLTHHEIPHSVAVMVEQLENLENKMIIDATIIVERDSQKGIIIGKGGSMKSTIIKLVSIDLRKFFQKKIDCKLFVKVEPNWRNKITKLHEIGYQKT